MEKAKDKSMNYTVNLDKGLAMERAVDQWVLGWCKKYHPEAFEEAEKFIKKLSKASQKE